MRSVLLLGLALLLPLTRHEPQDVMSDVRRLASVLHRRGRREQLVREAGFGRLLGGGRNSARTVSF